MPLDETIVDHTEQLLRRIRRRCSRLISEMAPSNKLATTLAMDGMALTSLALSLRSYAQKRRAGAWISKADLDAAKNIGGVHLVFIKQVTNQQIGDDESASQIDIAKENLAEKGVD